MVPSTWVIFPSSKQRTTWTLTHEFTAWGRVGFAIYADDYMQNSHNHYGIRLTRLMVDGREVFRADVNGIPYSSNRMVNSWGDYDHWLRHKTWYMKSFIEPGNTLNCLQADDNRGVIDFNEERDYQLEYILRDFKGNKARYPFTVHAQPSVQTVSYAAALPQQSSVLRWNRTNSYSRPGMQFIVPYGLVANDTPLRPVTVRRPEGWSDTFQFSPLSLPMMRNAELSIYVRRASTDGVVDNYDTTKLYITNEQGRYFGGDYKDGWVVGHVSELANCYELAYDDEPPIIKPVTINGNRLLLSVTDDQSGVASWTATVDGRFIVFDAIEKTMFYSCELSESWLRPTGKQHHLHFEATDNRHNIRVYETTFIY